MAGSDEQKRLERAAGLLDALADQHAKTGELLEDLTKIVAGETTIGKIMRRVSDHYLDVWEQRYHSKYVWQGAKDSAKLKRLLKILDVEDLEARIVAFLKDNDAFYVQTRHPFVLFAANVNRYATARPTEVLDPNWWKDCHHEPQCDTRVRHSVRLACDEERAKRPKDEGADSR
jgi:hypothetical protein